MLAPEALLSGSNVTHDARVHATRQRQRSEADPRGPTSAHAWPLRTDTDTSTNRATSALVITVGSRVAAGCR